MIEKAVQPALQMSWCASDTVWEHPGGIQHLKPPRLQAPHWTELSDHKPWGGKKKLTLIGSLCSTYFMQQPLHTYLGVVAAAWRTAGCLYMTGSRAGLKTSPAIWRKTDMLPNPEARSSGSRYCPSSADLGPFLWRNANHGKSQPEMSRSTCTLCFRNFRDSRHYFLR